MANIQNPECIAFVITYGGVCLFCDHMGMVFHARFSLL